MVRAGYRAVGVDTSSEALARFEERAIGVAHSIAADARALPFRAGAFPLVFCGTALSCVPKGDIPTAIAQAVRCLSPGGRFLYYDFSSLDPGASSKQAAGVSECAEITTTYLEVREAVAMLSGLIIERVLEIVKEDRSHGPAHKHSLFAILARKGA